MVRMPALASRILILKKRSDFTVGPFFMFTCRCQLSRSLLPYTFKTIAITVFNTNKPAKHTKAME